MIKLNEKYSINNGQGFIVFTEGNKDTVNASYTIIGHKSEGKINGILADNVLKGTFHIDAAAGLIEFTFSENGFDAKWKSGIEPGPLKGKWEGNISENDASSETHNDVSMKEKIIDQLKEMSQDESVYITLNVNNITEFRPQIGSLFDKKVSFEVVVISDFAELETELTVLKVLDLLEKKELADYVSSDFEELDIASTGPGDKKCINIKWEIHLTESEMIEMENIDLYADSNSEQIESTKVSFERDSVTNMSIECENGYEVTIDFTR